MAETKQSLGTIAFSLKGNYSPDVQYKKLSVVKHNRQIFVANQDNPTEEPTKTSTQWMYWITDPEMDKELEDFLTNLNERQVEIRQAAEEVKALAKEFNNDNLFFNLILNKVGYSDDLNTATVGMFVNPLNENKGFELSNNAVFKDKSIALDGDKNILYSFGFIVK